MDGGATEAELAAALRAGEAPTSERAMDAAEAARRHIHERFYDCPPSMHRNLADLYVTDGRFAKHYEDRAPGLARWVHDAIHANADRLPDLVNRAGDPGPGGGADVGDTPEGRRGGVGGGV